MRDLGGPFEEMKNSPILSGIFTESGIRRLDEFMMNLGFMTKYKMSIKASKTPLPGTPKRDVYLVRAYEYPSDWEKYTWPEIQDRLTAASERKLMALWPNLFLERSWRKASSPTEPGGRL